MVKVAVGLLDLGVGWGVRHGLGGDGDALGALRVNLDVFGLTVQRDVVVPGVLLGDSTRRGSGPWKPGTLGDPGSGVSSSSPRG